MKILKRCDDKQTRSFHCVRCGCEFEADKDEYVEELCSDGMQFGTKVYACNCPECNKIVRKEELKITATNIYTSVSNKNTSVTRNNYGKEGIGGT